MTLLPSSVAATTDRIREKLARAASAGVRPFGTEAHEFRLDPPLTEKNVRDFERQHGVELPEGYRAFLRRVGNGPAGPALGLIPLAESVGYGLEWVPADLLRQPFPHTTHYNPEDDLLFTSLTEEEYERWCPYQAAGTLTLCHTGCGAFDRLVVIGPTRGQMWVDATVNDAGFIPLGVDFLEWYERWLDDALAGRDGVRRTRA